MTMISAIATERCEALVESLRAEFGAIQTARILEAEAMDFLWDARVKERYLGQHFSIVNDGEELSRMAVVSFLGGSWHAGLCLVDGEGRPVDLLWKRSFDDMEDAQAVFDRAA